MPNLAEQIDADLILAQKAKNESKVGTLRMFKAALKNAQIQKMGDLTEEEMVKALRSEIKKRNDSIASYQQASRQDLVDKETGELEHLIGYLPAEMNDADLAVIVDKVIGANNFEAKDFGQAMKMVMAETKGTVAGQRISALVKEKLK
ncbi:MAG: GatB/YqeY domain-containing protein [Candidatus Komeilibacteria bacterium]|nr:GatB/YqeY domain-containing protein [Candidatus Komeilibacteria bacterium]